MGDEMVLAEMVFDGDALEVVELDGEGWVSLPSLLRPFGKRVDHAKGLLDGWARTRVEFVAPRQEVSNDHRAKATTLVLAAHVSLLIARLDHRGMDEATKSKHARYLREVAKVLFDYFTRGVAVNPRAAAAPDTWAAIQALAGGTLQLRQAVDETRATAESAKEIAVEAKKVAEQARTMAGARGLLEAVAAGTPPGRSSATPDGAWSAKPRPGYLSMRGLAREFALPSDGDGQGFVGRVARALGIQDDPAAVDRQDVVIGGRSRREHITYGPVARERLATPLRAAHATMVAHGYTVTYGVMRPAGVAFAKRAKAYVLREMLEAAVAGAAPVMPQQEEQQSIPGVVEERKAG